MGTASERHETDSPAIRKARGAFFTPPEIARFIATWAIRAPEDRVMEPSSGDAEFLVHAVDRLQTLGVPMPLVHGVELHEYSAQAGADRVAAHGGLPEIETGDFFDSLAGPRFDAVIGNPPYIRFQDFAGEARAKARSAALQGGVALTGLASAWAAFTVHAAEHLRPGGRLGFVLPAELLVAQYAAPVRRYLFSHFAQVDLVIFEDSVFAEAETETVLLLADGYGGFTASASVRQVRGLADLDELPPATTWTPVDPADRWVGSLLDRAVLDRYRELAGGVHFTGLGTWGDIGLGAVTGNNKFFALTPARVAELGLSPSDYVRISPPGSAHLRGLTLTQRALRELGAAGKRTMLFRPSADPSPAALAFIAEGEADGVQDAYKCRVRREWWRVPLQKPADLFLTYMNADTPRLVANPSGAHHLNSIHGVYLHPPHRELGLELLALASLNSLTLLGAEIVGRAYGGGLLKMEPGEADLWPMPSPETVTNARDELLAIRPQVAGRLRAGKLAEAVKLVDDSLLIGSVGLRRPAVAEMKDARDLLAARRENRSRATRSTSSTS